MSKFKSTLDGQVIILTTKTVEKLLSLNPDSLVLYLFYQKNAKIQETNTVFTTNTFAKKGLGWGQDRLRKAKDILTEHNLIEKVVRKSKSGKITGHYIKINYIWGKEATEKTITPETHSMVQTTDGKEETNALSNKTTNALSNKNQILDTKEKEDGVILPVKDSKSYIDRLTKLYGTLFKLKMGFSPKIEFGRDGKILSSLKKEYSELQLASMMLLYFDWRGMEDNDDRGYQWLLDNAFPITIMKSKINSLEAYMRNVADVDFDDDNDLLKMVMKSLDKLKDK